MLHRIGLMGRQGQASGLPGPSLDLDFMSPGSLPSGVTLTRTTTATYFDISGVMQTAAINAPRWDYDPATHVLRGMLIEEARTNLLLNSATLGTQSVAVTAQAYVLSFYGTGTITLSGVSTAGPLTGSGAYPARVSLAFTPTAGTLTCTVTGNVQSAQLEAGAFATSYIPTTAATVTRAIDSATMSLPAAMINPPAFSLAAEVLPLSLGPTSYLQADDGTINNRVVFSSNAASAVVNYADVVGGVTIVGGLTAGSLTQGVAFKEACSVAPGTRISALNSALSGSNTNASAAAAINTLRFGKSTGATTGAQCARRVRGWPRALSAAELQAVTT